MSYKNHYKNKYFNLNYYQKSFYYLYPLLGFKRSDLFTPINTYLKCSISELDIQENRLLVLYKHHNNDLFDKFEKEHIINNPFFESICYTEDGGLYTFNMSLYTDTVENFMRGEYTKIRNSDKQRILNYFGFKVSPELMAEGKIPIIEGSIYPMTTLYFSLFKSHFAKFLSETLDIYDTEEEALKIISDMKEVTPIFDSSKEYLETNLVEAVC